ncbi:MAG: YcxB family protein [Eubacterium sp.]|nr:YcxB family protein [Eubacterium sp.]
MSIRIQTKVDFKSMGQFLLYHYYTQISGIFSVLISLAAIVFAVWRWTVLRTEAKIALIVIGLMFTVLQPLMLLFRAKKQMKSGQFDDSFTYVFDDNGLTISQEDRSQQFTWQEVRKIKYRKDAIYVYMSNIRAFILPKDQIGSRYDELVALMKEKKSR